MYIQQYMKFDRFGGTENDEPSKAIQSSKDECDINTIVRRFGVTGVLPTVQVPPSYQQFGEVFDFQSAMNLVLEAQQSFAGMNADVRMRFANDPGRFVDFCQDPANTEEMRKMGLLVPEVIKEDVPKTE